MNFLVITNELQLSSLSPELKKLYDSYQNILAKRTEFQTLRKSNANKELYNKKCKELAATIKGITYRSDRMTFDVRPTLDGKRIWLGSEKDFDNAAYLLSEYLKYKLENK